MKRDWTFYRQLFGATFRISAVTFGGGFVIISLLRKKIVNEYRWMEDKEMLNLTAIAQSAPGGVAINASIIIGYRLAGLMGTVVALAATVLPPLIILSILSFFYTAFRDNTVVQLALKGLQIGVLAVIADVVIDLTAPIIKDKKILPIGILLGAFAGSCFLSVNILFLLFLSGLLGALFLREPKGNKAEDKLVSEKKKSEV